MSEKRSMEIRVNEKAEQLRQALEKAEQYKAQLKQLQARKADEDRRQRTHNLILCGAEMAAIFGKTLEEEEIHLLGDFLRRKVEAGEFFLAEGLSASVPSEEAQQQKEESEKTDPAFWEDPFNF